LCFPFLRLVTNTLLIGNLQKQKRVKRRTKKRWKQIGERERERGKENDLHGVVAALLLLLLLLGELLGMHRQERLDLTTLLIQRFIHILELVILFPRKEEEEEEEEVDSSIPSIDNNK